jgi:hypothetical protein
MQRPTTSEGWRRLAEKMSNRAEIQDETRAGLKLAVGYARRSLYAWRQAVALERRPEKFIVMPVAEVG